MRIGIEAFRIFRNHKHGMDIVAIEQIKKLQFLDKINTYYLFCFNGPDHFLIQECENFKIIRLPRLPSPFMEQVVLPILSFVYQLDLLHSTGNTSPLFVSCKRLITLHDIIYLENNKCSFGGSIYQKIGKWYRRQIVPIVIQKAEMLITVSATEQRTIEDFAPQLNGKISFIYNAVSSHFMPKPLEHTLTSALKYKLPREPYILFHGNTDPKKNTINVLKAFDIFKKKSGSNIKLVITDLSSGVLNQLLNNHKLSALKSEIHLTNYVHNSEMPDLYNRALIYLYPSLRESFGIPILEAMACGTPVITSDCSAMPEIAGGSALLANPASPEKIADALLKFYKDEKLRKMYAQKGMERVRNFNWHTSVEKLLQLYTTILKPALSKTPNLTKSEGQPAYTS